MKGLDIVNMVVNHGMLDKEVIITGIENESPENWDEGETGSSIVEGRIIESDDGTEMGVITIDGYVEN